jgi:hypothetical protein
MWVVVVVVVVMVVIPEHSEWDICQSKGNKQTWIRIPALGVVFQFGASSACGKPLVTGFSRRRNAASVHVFPVITDSRPKELVFKEC